MRTGGTNLERGRIVAASTGGDSVEAVGAGVVTLEDVVELAGE